MKILCYNGNDGIGENEEDWKSRKLAPIILNFSNNKKLMRNKMKQGYIDKNNCKEIISICKNKDALYENEQCLEKLNDWLRDSSELPRLIKGLMMKPFDYTRQLKNNSSVDKIVFENITKVINDYNTELSVSILKNGVRDRAKLINVIKSHINSVHLDLKKSRKELNKIKNADDFHFIKKVYSMSIGSHFASENIEKVVEDYVTDSGIDKYFKDAKSSNSSGMNVQKVIKIADHLKDNQAKCDIFDKLGEFYKDLGKDIEHQVMDIKVKEIKFNTFPKINAVKVNIKVSKTKSVKNIDSFGSDDIDVLLKSNDSIIYDNGSKMLLNDRKKIKEIKTKENQV